MSEIKVDVATLGLELDVRYNPLEGERVTLFESLIESGVYLPPIEVYSWEGKLCVKDGRHRVEAYKRLGKTSILAIEVPYTTGPQMLVDALASNMTKKGAPLPPTTKDFSNVIRQLSKNGIAKPDAIRMLEKINVPTTFARKMVNQTYHSVRKFAELHATDTVKANRMTAVEASQHYNVDVKTIHRKLAEVGGYNVSAFALDVNKKLKTFRAFIVEKLINLEGVGSPELAGEALKTSLRKDIEELSRWVEAQIVSRR